MKQGVTFEDRLLRKLREQITGRSAGFLLGAGASYLAGQGYPLASALWPSIRERMNSDDQRVIDAQIVGGCLTLEEALDAVDQARSADPSLRHRVTRAIAESFGSHTAPLAFHRAFVQRLSARQERRVPVFTLNYDALLELAADAEQRPVFDGFRGTIEACFAPACFADLWGHYESRKGRWVLVPYRGAINLHKLHGSLGWYVDQHSTLRRIRPDMPCPDGWRHLMVPPQNRKAADTGLTPYATLWSEFRAYLANDSSRLLHRLVCVGYGLGDGHVNAIIKSALDRKHFTLVIMSKMLSDEAFEDWSSFPNAIIVTETRASLYGERGGAPPEAWSFEWLAREV